MRSGLVLLQGFSSAQRRWVDADYQQNECVGSSLSGLNQSEHLLQKNVRLRPI